MLAGTSGYLPVASLHSFDSHPQVGGVCPKDRDLVVSQPVAGVIGASFRWGTSPSTIPSKHPPPLYDVMKG